LPIIGISSALFAAAIIIWRMRQKRLNAPAVLTWDCGYDAPTTRMQYTFSSFVQPLLANFRKSPRPPLTKKIFPDNESQNLAVDRDPIEAFLNHYLLKKLSRITTILHWIQHGYLNLYILYIFVTLLLLLIFKCR